jgi:alanyl-tRNA synthetase
VGFVTSISSIRQAFLDHFKAAGHVVEPSAPLVPDDPSLMFTAAGMVPFKRYFTGEDQAPFARAASSQKCLRAGGKHNDLDNVGFTARHHTFFEMLGNFSFGDYFKEEAIALAWSLITREFGLPRDRLLVTVYADDEEAVSLWRRIAGVPDERIIRIATSDNFWSMGDAGPCGPCSEIFFDHGPEIAGGPPGSPDEDGDRFVEIWNLVFMQYDQPGDGSMVPLPRPSIDTGMGLERIATVLQGVHSNYETDLFKALIAAVDIQLGKPQTSELAASGRVIADHLRAGTFLIADGVLPTNEGRGYVLRRILRRAMRHAHMRGAEEPVLNQLVGTLVSQMGEAYPEIVRAQALVEETFRQEEERFQKMLGRGLAMLDDEVRRLSPGAVLPGDVAFRLHDTFGFPLDLTQDALRLRGIGVDVAGFEASMAHQQAEARANWQGSGSRLEEGVWRSLSQKHPASLFTGYSTLSDQAVILALLDEEGEVSELGAGRSGYLLTNRTPFYAEGGGQVGDRGTGRSDSAAFAITDTKKRGDGLHVHSIEVQSGKLRAGDGVTLDVDCDHRIATIANHTATHLLHAALRRVLGGHVTQRGSYVGPDRLRFDFSHDGAIDESRLARIEDDVNAAIRKNMRSQISHMTPKQAIDQGALALFGEKYGEEVRVLRLAGDGEATPVSMELCGGTHVERTGDIGSFVIVSQSGVSAGVRRIEALTGQVAMEFMRGQARRAQDLADLMKVPVAQAESRLHALLDERRELEKQVRETKRLLAMGGGPKGIGTGSDAVARSLEAVRGVSFIGRVLPGVDAKDLRSLVDNAKAEMGSGIAVLIAVSDEGKAAVSVGVTDDLTNRFDARELVRVAAATLGGKGGGGRADLAQAGGPDGGKGEAALGAVRAALEEGHVSAG